MSDNPLTHRAVELSLEYEIAITLNTEAQKCNNIGKNAMNKAATSNLIQTKFNDLNTYCSTRHSTPTGIKATNAFEVSGTFFKGAVDSNKIVLSKKSTKSVAEFKTAVQATLITSTINDQQLTNFVSAFKSYNPVAFLDSSDPVQAAIREKVLFAKSTLDRTYGTGNVTIELLPFKSFPEHVPNAVIVIDSTKIDAFLTEVAAFVSPETLESHEVDQYTACLDAYTNDALGHFKSAAY
jgi:hypothetical protein